MVAQAVAMATMTSCFVQKPWPSDFDPLFLFVPPFQHCHMTQHRILHTPSGLPWWHKPSLWQQFAFSKTRKFANSAFSNAISLPKLGFVNEEMPWIYASFPSISSSPEKETNAVVG